jgi:hypothetical protein
MAIVKVGLNPKRATQTQKSYDFTTGIITTTVQQFWIVVFDAPNSDPTLCYTASVGSRKIPQIGDAYSTIGPYVNRVQPVLDPTSAGKMYHVQVDYTSLPQAQVTASKWNITVSTDGAPVTESVYADSAGKAYVNSAGQPFQQQRTKTYFDNIYRVGFNSKSLDVASIDALQGCLNLNAFTLKIDSLKFSKSFEAQSTLLARCPTSVVLTSDPTNPAYWQAEYELHYRKPIKSPIDGSIVSGWTVFELDQGYCELVSGALKAIVDSKTGLPLTAPQYLDGSGSKSTTAHFLQFAPDELPGNFTPLFTGIS